MQRKYQLVAYYNSGGLAFSVFISPNYFAVSDVRNVRGTNMTAKNKKWPLTFPALTKESPNSLTWLDLVRSFCGAKIPSKFALH